jgi:outer membrane protein TolC
MLQSICVTLPLGGCLLAGDKPEPGLNIPPAYSAGPRNPAAAEAAMPPLDWWRGFRSRELTEIIEEARAAILDIAAAVARIVQADANSRIVGAALLPIIDLNANGTHSQQSKTTGSSSVVNLSRSGASVQNINNNLTPTKSAS